MDSKEHRKAMKRARQAEKDQNGEEQKAGVVGEEEGEPSHPHHEELASLHRKLARAISKGKVSREARLRERIATLDPGSGDKAMEESLQRTFGCGSSGALPPPLPPPPSDPGSPIVPEGMVLGKNGKLYPKPPPPTPGNTTLLLFYAYVQPPWNPRARAAAVDFAHATLSTHSCTGRLRVALEGFNGTLTGPAKGIRAFCDALRVFSPEHFGSTDYKFVDGLPDNKLFRTLKVWPVEELVTYGFSVDQAPLSSGGKHVSPKEWTELSSQPNTVMIDVRNANETAIGRFAPPQGGAVLLDPRMRRSTEFPGWVDKVLPELEGKRVLMYCTGGVRCERASALLAQKGVPRESIVQLEGGIHRYLEAYSTDGGIWAGKNYTFDKRFSHGAEKSSVVGKCAGCKVPWERYQSQDKCSMCKMEMLVCRECQRGGVPKKQRLLCWLCEELKEGRGKGGGGGREAAERAARAFAATGGGRDGEGEGKHASQVEDEGEERGGGKAGGKRHKGF